MAQEKLPLLRILPSGLEGEPHRTEISVLLEQVPEANLPKHKSQNEQGGFRENQRDGAQAKLHVSVRV